MNGKGSRKRPCFVEDNYVEKEWNRIFRKDKENVASEQIRNQTMHNEHNPEIQITSKDNQSV